MDWTRAGLEAEGFIGFVRFASLPSEDVPATPGVYVVLRESPAAPLYLKVSPAGHFKQRDPSTTLAKLHSKWIASTPVLYIGKATGGRTGRRTLRKRLDEYRRHGTGEPIGHWGGRYLWQLTDSADLVVCWRETSAIDSSRLEGGLLEGFAQAFGALPFANLRHERGSQSRG